MTGMIDVNEPINRLSAEWPTGSWTEGVDDGREMAIAKVFARADLTELWEN